jgi:mannose-1-phosphate guanylyltransferase/mannose-6-phosphate isomerase
MHHHRTLHLIVLRGTAKLNLNGKDVFLHENESYFVPKSTSYSIQNVGKLPLELIEVQSGEYLGDDDEEVLE